MCEYSFIICRCEEVTLEELQSSILAGARTTQELKMATRAGMGMCQGRICRSLLERLVPSPSNEVLDSPSHLTIHQPVRPVALCQISGEGNGL
ncbi:MULTISPECIES: (2Fe-2S)-binding protein [unclassified Bacillus (in: firmicutes)]|uniref:(2Fe-2S)-binding protein n=1 Tax=unclassified Bacillus (in: firmicutes) TaxID=185979 RepID=UPI0008F0871D|nr:MULTISPECIES: (2Fe-2S)-binding protein [unclassified Bacillus (in: firmicutes)]SFA69697.1 BFD-like [2Fe-2S] binding domain-containing protein [Bacillus sp. UNCCL13]SFQ59029.1 BFD-like [2Fe-2S] binding domain-containing protein [Bacillus sp. cl95]